MQQSSPCKQKHFPWELMYSRLFILLKFRAQGNPWQKNVVNYSGVVYPYIIFPFSEKSHWEYMLHRKLNQLWMIQYPTGSVSPEQQKRILQAIEQIKQVMEVDSMKAMYTQYVNQEKQSVYLAQVYKELKATISQLRNEASMMPQVRCSL